MPAAFLLAAAILGAGPPCAAIPGATEILSDKSVEWVVVGEHHGTSETPAIFADLACLAASTGRAPVIALELPASDAEAINAFLASPNEDDAMRQLLQRPFWHGSLKDGRSSEAMALLLKRLRQMKAKGLIRGVVPVQPFNMLPGPAFEQAMADNVRRSSPSGNDLVLVLVGNLHARLSEPLLEPVRDLPPQPRMASFLPKDRTVSLSAEGNGGAQWSCVLGRTSQNFCGPSKPLPALVQRSRGIVRLSGAGSTYSGYLNIGTATTPSSPAVAP